MKLYELLVLEDIRLLESSSCSEHTNVYTGEMDIVWVEDERFVWDEDKYERNYLEHGILFEEVTPIFFSPAAYFDATKKEYGERRSKTIGSIEGVTVVVVFTHRVGKIRIISARPATGKEKSLFNNLCVSAMRRFFEY